MRITSKSLKASYRLHNLIFVLHVLPNQGYEKMSLFCQHVWATIKDSASDNLCIKNRLINKNF